MRFGNLPQSRVLIGTVVNIVVIVAFLKYGDSRDPFAVPSHIILGSPVWEAGIIWWVESGIITGFVATLATVRAHDRSLETGLPIIFLSSAFAALILGIIALISANQLSPYNVLVVGGLYIVFYVLISFFPALLSLAIFNAISGFIGGVFTQSTASTIMPPDLRRSYEEERAQAKLQPLHKRLLRR